MKRNRLFTLLELVVSTAMMAMMIGMVSMVIFGMVKEWGEVERNAQMLREFQAIDRLVETAFRNAIPFHWNYEKQSETEDPPMLFTGEPNEIYFTYRHPAAGEPPTALRFIRIYRDGDQLIAAYRNTPILPNDVKNETQNVIKEVLANNIFSVDFLYATRDPANGSVSWLSYWNNDELKDIPLAIQIQITWHGVDDTSDRVTEAWLRRTAGNGFAEAYDVRSDEFEKENKPVEDLIKAAQDNNTNANAATSGGGGRGSGSGGGSGGGGSGGGSGGSGGSGGGGSGGGGSRR